MTTRVQIASVLDNAFASGPVDKSELLGHAIAEKAEPEVIETLTTLPERRYGNLRELWEHLQGVPVGA